MNKANKDKMEVLNIKNYKFAKRFYRDLSAAAKNEKEREEVFSDFTQLVYDCQLKEQDVSTAIPDYNKFFKETVNNINRKNKPVSLVCKHKRLLISITSFALIIAAGLLSLFYSGAYQLSQKGWRYYINTDKYIYTGYKTEIDEFEIDLRSLDSNYNKVIYDDGICKIYIRNVSGGVSTGIDGTVKDCYYMVELLAIGRMTCDYSRIVCGISSTPGIISSQPISYQIGGESFNERTLSSNFGGATTKKNEAVTHFLIKGEEKAKELYAMSKIIVKIDDFYVNEWIKK